MEYTYLQSLMGFARNSEDYVHGAWRAAMVAALRVLQRWRHRRHSITDTAQVSYK